MGVKLTELLKIKEINFDDLKGKTVAIDASNHLYQFLSSIRERDGSLLKDSKGQVTSHLVGLFSRTTNLMQKNIKLVYVFDGKVPELKHAETARRKSIKIEAQKKYEDAAERQDVEEMKKYASRTSRLTPEMIAEAKKLLLALGIPIVQAPAEGEAQASYMTQKDVYAIASQDADSLIFGAKRVIRNLSITGKKKMPGKLNYTDVSPELIILKENIEHLNITQDQLIALSILIGTDYNTGGIKGIGPKNALKLVKEYKTDFDAMFKHAKWDEHFGYSWKEVFDTIKNMPVTDDYSLNWGKINKDEVVKLLVHEHDFSLERVNSSLEKAAEAEKAQKSSLAKWF